MEKKTYDIKGMSCVACASAVTRAVKKVSGTNNINVNLMQNKMTLEQADDVTDNMIIKAVTDAGYEAYITDKSHKTQKKQGNYIQDLSTDFKNRAVISFAFLIPLMYFGMGGMFNAPFPSAFKGNGKILLALTELLLTIPIIFTGRAFFINGLRHLYKRNPNMDTLIAIGSGASFLYSLYSLYTLAYFLSIGERTSVNLYFDSAGMILTLITFGKFLEARSKKRTTDAISNLVNLIPETATVIRNNKKLTISVSEIIKGDTIIIKAGETIPVDGVILTGSCAVDESMITGESIPVEKNVKNEVIGGTISRSGYFTFKATKIGEDTALHKIISLVEEASSSKAPISRLADRISGVFVPIVLGISLVTFITWLILNKDFSFALNMAVAVLVISCPCALGLATPAAIMVGTGKGAERGILIKTAESFETAHKIDVVVLDKTGTITEGKPKVKDIFVNNIKEDEFISLAASIENASSHPLANAINEYAKGKNITTRDVKNFEIIEGRGVRGEIGDKTIFAGNEVYMKELGVKNRYKDITTNLSNFGKTVLYFTSSSAQNELLGIISVADTIKVGSKSAIKKLISLGVDVIMLTGDNEQTANVIAREIGLKGVIAEVKPSDKEEQVRILQEQGKKVMMVGDGINDAPALARADIGVAIGAGVDVAIDTADIILMHSDLKDIPYLLLLSREVVKKIKENLFWALFYNALCIPIAAGVLFASFGLKLNPMLGALAMSFSSFFVLTNSLRLRFFKYEGESHENNEAVSMVLSQRDDKNQKEKEFKMDKIIEIEGMMCLKCVKHVTNALNSIEGVNAEVSLENKNAVVHLEKEVSDEALKKAIEDEEYVVKSIKSTCK